MMTQRERIGRHAAVAAIAIGSLIVAGGCGKSQQQAQQGPVEVSVVEAKAEALPIYNELPGRISALRVAEVRARVTGVLEKRLFTEGSDVKAGDQLFLIDPAPSQAAYDSARATLEQANATLAQDELTTKRYSQLVKSGAVSQQTYDDAAAALAAQKAAVDVAKAALRTADINLGYTKVTSPISGRIGKALVTEGALVSSGELTELAVVQQIDKVYFDFSQSNADVLKLRRAIAAGKLSSDNSDTKVTLTLEDGTTYEHEGKLLFSDISVDEDTAMVTMRAEFPNPEHLLLPGSFARVKIAQAVSKNAVTILQRAVSRNTDGTGTVYVVGKNNMVESRTITTSDAVDNRWVVTSGLSAGDTVIVEGIQKVRDGSAVTTVPFGAAKTAAAGADASNAGKVE